MMKKNIFIAVLALMFAFAGASRAQASTTFNTDPQDRATVRVANQTLNPNCTTCWSTSANASAGQVVSVAIYYHNTGTEAAPNTKVRLIGMSSQTNQSSSFTILGNVVASNSNTASGSAQINLSSSQTLTFIQNSAKWFPNQTTVGQSLPNGQTGLEIFNTGIDLGTIAPGWSTQGSVVLRFQVSGSQQSIYACNDGIDNDGDGYVDMNDPGCNSSSDNDEYNPTNNNNNAYAPDVTTSTATSIDTDAAIIRGSYDANGASTTTWFEYARSYNDVDDGDGTIVGTDYQGLGSGSMSYHLTGLRDNTTYYFRAVAQNSYGTDRGAIKSFTTDSENNNTNTGDVTALTSLSSAVTQTTAVVNGVVENSTGYSADGWFEYGRTTSLGSRTPARSLGASSSRSMSETISGLSPDTIYYFRAVAQSDAGDVSRGDILVMKTAAPVVVTTPTVITTPTPTPVTTTVVTGTSSRYVFIKIENRFENVYVGDTVNYTVTYKNISSRTLNKVVIEVAFPKEVQFSRAAQGEYDSDRKVLVINLGTLAPGDEGTIAVDGKVLSAAKTKDALLTNAVMKYTNPFTTVQEEAIAYVVNKVSKDNSNNLGAASIFGDGSFLPTTLLGWLFLILVIFGLVVLGRHLYNKNQMAKGPAAH